MKSDLTEKVLFSTKSTIAWSTLASGILSWFLRRHIFANPKEKITFLCIKLQKLIPRIFYLHNQTRRWLSPKLQNLIPRIFHLPNQTKRWLSPKFQKLIPHIFYLPNQTSRWLSPRKLSTSPLKPTKKKFESRLLLNVSRYLEIFEIS